MELIAVGIEKASLTLREQVNFTDSMKLSFYQIMRENSFDNGLILSTCNRSEVYATSSHCDIHKLEALYRAFFHLSSKESVICLYGKEALYHLLQVVSGLASVLVGEDQIYAQVKAAYAFANHAQMVDKTMHVMLQEAFHIAKTVRSAYKLNEQPLSSAYAAIKLLKQQTILEGKRILLCGSGNMIGEMLPYLCDQELHMLIRSHQRQQILKKQYPAIVFHPMTERRIQWEQADIVITATSSPHLLFPYEKTESIKKKIVLDLAMPRDVDPYWEKEPEIALFDIDTIQRQMDVYVKQRMILAKEAEGYVQKQRDRLWKHLCHLEKEPLMEVLHKKLLQASDDTYALLNEKLSLSQHEQFVMKKTLDYAFQHYLGQIRELLTEGEDDMQEVLLKALIKEDQR